MNEQSSNYLVVDLQSSCQLHSVFHEALHISTVNMPGRRKRTTTTDEPKTKRSKSSHQNATINYKKPVPVLFSMKHCERWFRSYAKFGTDVIEPDGMERLCLELGVPPENIVLLVLAWKLNADRMGYFTLDEWKKGMGELECDSVEKLRSKLPQLSLILNDVKSFKTIYRYAFDFTRDRDQRSIDIDTGKLMISLLLEKWVLLPDFLHFLDQSKYRVINKDQWNNILEFSRTIQPSLLNYDEDGAWPVLLDEFVEWQRARWVRGEQTGTTVPGATTVLPDDTTSTTTASSQPLHTAWLHVT